jgi:hypothetical protein
MSNDDQSNNPDQSAPKSRPVVRLAKDEAAAEPVADNVTEPEPKTPQLPSWLQKGSVETKPEPETDSEPEQVVVAQEEAAPEEASVEDSQDSEPQSDMAKILDEVIAEESSDSEEVVEVESSEEDLTLTPTPAYDPPSGPIPQAPAAPSYNQAMQTMNEWATKWNVADDPYVAGLNAAVARRDNMTMWASLDPTDMLPTPEIQSGRLLSRIARVLTVARNVLVFVPVALTWLAIQNATDAFGKWAADKTSADPESGISFIQFWQNGYGFLDDKYRIQNIAKLDFYLITLIVIATLVASLLESRAKSTASVLEKSADRERLFVGLKIAEALQGNKTASPESITESLAFALNDLSQAARDVSLAAARMEVASVGVESLTPRVESLNKQVGELNQRFGKDVVGSVDSLVSSVSTLGVTLGGDMQKFLSDILAGLEEVDKQLKGTAVGVEFGTKLLRDDLDAMHQRLAQLTNGRR